LSPAKGHSPLVGPQFAAKQGAFICKPLALYLISGAPTKIQAMHTPQNRINNTPPLNAKLIELVPRLKKALEFGNETSF